jgi:hypothetical protein
VIQEGAYADILLIDGNPLKDLWLLGDNAKNLIILPVLGLLFAAALYGGMDV